MNSAKLEFDLPEGREEFIHVTRAMNYYKALEDIREYFRRKLKYTELSEAEFAIYEQIRDDVYNIINLEIYD